MYDQSIPFTAYAFIGITSLVVTYSYITSNQDKDNENEIDKKEAEETPINSINSISGIEPSPDLGENVPNFGGKKTKKLQKGGTENKLSLLDLLKTGKDLNDISKELVKNNYKELFENGEGEIKNPNIFQITFKTSDGDKFPNVKICFIRYIHDNDNNIYGIVSHYMDKKTGKCPGRGYESYFYFDEEEAINRDKYFLLDIEYLDLVDKIKEREKSMVDVIGNKIIPAEIRDKTKDYMGGKKINRKTQNKKYKITKPKQHNLTNKRK